MTAAQNRFTSTDALLHSLSNACASVAKGIRASLVTPGAVWSGEKTLCISHEDARTAWHKSDDSQIKGGDCGESFEKIFYIMHLLSRTRARKRHASLELCGFECKSVVKSVSFCLPLLVGRVPVSGDFLRKGHCSDSQPAVLLLSSLLLSPYQKVCVESPRGVQSTGPPDGHRHSWPVIYGAENIHFA